MTNHYNCAELLNVKHQKKTQKQAYQALKTTNTPQHLKYINLSFLLKLLNRSTTADIWPHICLIQQANLSKCFKSK